MPAKAVDRVVIDANVALKSALVANGFAGWDGLHLYAPTLIWSETASAASQLRWRGEITADQAGEALQRIRDARFRIVPSAELVDDALRLAQRFGWAKTYDAEYVALAKRLSIPLLTTDGRLAARVRDEIRVTTPVELDRELQAER